MRHYSKDVRWFFWKSYTTFYVMEWNETQKSKGRAEDWQSMTRESKPGYSTSPINHFKTLAISRYLHVSNSPRRITQELAVWCHGHVQCERMRLERGASPQKQLEEINSFTAVVGDFWCRKCEGQEWDRTEYLFWPRPPWFFSLPTHIFGTFPFAKENQSTGIIRVTRMRGKAMIPPMNP